MEDKVLINFMNEQSRAMGAVSQQVSDIHTRLFDEDGLESRVKSVEKKVWYATGFGAAIGTALSYLGFKLNH